MWGRVTFVTRHTLAAVQSSSMEAFFRRRDSRRHSMGTSSPSLLRNLKQWRRSCGTEDTNHCEVFSA